MNFHISNLSPLRPQFSSPSLGAPRRHHPAGANHSYNDSGPLKIEVVEPADADDDDEVTNGTRGRADDDDDDDDDTDSLSDGSADDVAQDSRDVLVQRLTDLAARLSGADVRTASIEALHRQVDDMERELRRSSSSRDHSAHSSRRSSRRRRRPGSSSMQPAGPRPRSLQLPLSSSPSAFGGGEPPRGRDALGIMAPMSPSWFMSQFQKRPSVQSREAAGGAAEPGARAEPYAGLHSSSDSLVRQPPRPPAEPSGSGAGSGSGEVSSSAYAPNISSEVVEDVVKEAEKLCAEMATVIESLQTRREESDHLHTILIQREEVANKRVHDKDVAVGELEDVVAGNEAELRHLRLELRAIEVQCMAYVPEEADPELTQSIRNWKDDWHELREKWSSRRGSSFASGDESSTLSTLASPTSC